MTEHDSKKLPKHGEEGEEMKKARQKEAIADAADEEDGRPDLARDRKPKPEDAKKAKGSKRS